MTRTGARVLAATVGAVMLAGAISGCSGRDSGIDDLEPGDAAVGAGAPGTTAAPVVAFVRPKPGAGAIVEYDDGTWACDAPSQFISVGVATDGSDSYAATAEEAALADEDPATVTIEQIGEQLNAPPANPGDPHVDLAAFAVRVGGELVAVKVVEHDAPGWRTSSSKTCS